MKSRSHRYTAILSLVLMAALFSGIGMAEADGALLKKDLGGGITLKEDVKTYGPETLYEYINGQAVFYLSYKFKTLEHGYYTCKGGAYYVDVYELGSDLSAFGAFRQQRDEAAEAYDAGTEAAVLDYLTTFFKGVHYVEIIPMESGDNDVEAMKLIASAIDKVLPGEKKLPKELEFFPKAHLVKGSERYVDENLISYSFMGAGMVARYKLPGSEEENRVFIAMTEGDFRAFSTITEYENKITDARNVRLGSAKGIVGKEEYRGTTMVGKYNKYLVGCLDITDENAARKLLTELVKNLQKAR